MKTNDYANEYEIMNEVYVYCETCKNPAPSTYSAMGSIMFA